MWHKERYRIVTENPYNKKKLNGLGLVMYSDWNDSLVDIILKNDIKHFMDLTPIYNLEQLSMLDIPNRGCYPVKINCYWNWDDYGKTRKNWLTEK